MATDRNVPHALNSPEYWDHRFMTDWDQKGGPDQTAFFSALALALMPQWLKSELQTPGFTLLDYGCAEGAALPRFADAFPALTLSGTDISAVAIAKAQQRHPQFEFFGLQSQDVLPFVDVVFSSNTLEHIADWRATLTSLALVTRRHLVIVAPFREKAPLFEEHCASFDYDSLPSQLENGLRLVHVSACETTRLPGSMWVGEQFLAVWSKEAGTGSDAVAHAEADVLDLRAVATVAVPGALDVAKRAYAKLAETREALRLARQAADQANAQSEYRLTLAANEALTTRVALENEAHAKRVELENALYEARKESERLLGEAQYRSTLAANEAHAKRVELENALYEARKESERLLGEAQYRSTLAANEAQEKRVELENALYEARKESERLLGEAQYSSTLAANEALTKRVELENALYEEKSERERLLAEAKYSSTLAAKDAEAKRVELENALNQAKKESARLLSELAAAQKAHTKLEGMLHQIREAIGDEPAFVAPDDTLATRVQKLRQEFESISRSLVTGSAAFADEFNARLAAKERVVQASVDTLRQNYLRITSMRSFRLMMRGLSKYARVRGTPITLPPSPERLSVTFDRVDGQTLLRTLWNRPPGKWSQGAARLQQSPRSQAASQPVRPPHEEVVLLQVDALDRGGVEQVVYDLALGFRAKGEHVVVFAVNHGGEVADRLVNRGIPVEIFGGWSPEAYRRAVAALKVKTAYLHGTLDGADILAQAGIPVVEVVHNYYHWLQHDVPAYSMKAVHVGRFVAVSSGVADFHADVFGIARDRIEVVNNAINPDNFIRPERRLLEWSRRDWESRFVFVNVAQFVPPKAHAALIAAFAKVHRAHPHARLRLIGGAADADTAARATDQIARLGLVDAVDMPGFLDRRGLSAALASANVFVQPSVFEGYSVAMTEAAYFGLPLILTDIGGASDLVNDGDCGILVPPPLPTFKGVSQVRINDIGLAPDAPHVPALAAAMTEMLVNYRTWSPRGYVAQRRIEQFDVSAQVNQYRR